MAGKAWSVGAMAAVLLAVVQGCDPCAGTATCERAPHLSLSGQIVQAATGDPAAGTTVSVVTGGDSLVTTTDADGFWHVERDAASDGPATVDVVVQTPGVASYRVPGLQVPLVTRAGDAHLLDRWVAAPGFATQVQLFYRGTADTPVQGAALTFHRTGGVELLGGGDGLDTTRSDAAGRAFLLPYTQVAAGFGDVIGDLVVTLPGGQGTSVLHGVRASSTYRYKDAIAIERLAVGPSLDYAIRFYDRATGRPQPGVRVGFTRTGGVATAPGAVSVTSDSTGTVNLRMRALGTGDVIGTMVITPPAPAHPDTIRNLHIPTFDAEGGRLFRNFGVGIHLPYYGFVRLNGKGLDDVRVVVRRTGGIDVTPATWEARTVTGGVLFLHPVPATAGEVVLDLQFFPPAPYASFTVKGLRLATVERDEPAGINVWVWDIERGPSGPPGTQVTTP